MMLAKGGTIYGLEARWGLAIIAVLTVHFLFSMLAYTIGGWSLPASLLCPAPVSVPLVAFILIFKNGREPDFALDWCLDVLTRRTWSASPSFPFRSLSEAGRVPPLGQRRPRA